MKLTLSAVLRSFAETALYLGLLAGATSGSATVLTATDTSWKITPNGPPAAGWNSNATFDDSGWQSATVITAYDPYMGAEFIWSSGGQHGTEPQVWARSVFNVGTLPLSAVLNSIFDDDGDIFINGTLVVSDHDGQATNNPSVDITSYLTLGDNLIAFTVTDNYEFWGSYNHAAAAVIDATFAQVPEPGTLALLGLGLAGLGLMRRRDCRCD